MSGLWFGCYWMGCGHVTGRDGKRNAAAAGRPVLVRRSGHYFKFDLGRLQGALRARIRLAT